METSVHAVWASGTRTLLVNPNRVTLGPAFAAPHLSPHPERGDDETSRAETLGRQVRMCAKCLLLAAWSSREDRSAQKTG